MLNISRLLVVVLLACSVIYHLKSIESSSFVKCTSNMCACALLSLYTIHTHVLAMIFDYTAGFILHRINICHIDLLCFHSLSSFFFSSFSSSSHSVNLKIILNVRTHRALSSYLTYVCSNICIQLVHSPNRFSSIGFWLHDSIQDRREC